MEGASCGPPPWAAPFHTSSDTAAHHTLCFLLLFFGALCFFLLLCALAAECSALSRSTVTMPESMAVSRGADPGSQASSSRHFAQITLQQWRWNCRWSLRSLDAVTIACGIERDFSGRAMMDEWCIRQAWLVHPTTTPHPKGVWNVGAHSSSPAVPPHLDHPVHFPNHRLPHHHAAWFGPHLLKTTPSSTAVPFDKGARTGHASSVES